MDLEGLLPYFSPEREYNDKRPILLVDNTRKALTFFKYKAKLIDCTGDAIRVALKAMTKEEAIEQTRLGLAYGIKSGDVVVLHFGDSIEDWGEYFKG